MIKIICCLLLIGCSHKIQDPTPLIRSTNLTNAPWIQKGPLLRSPLMEATPVYFQGRHLIVSTLLTDYGTDLAIYENDQLIFSMPVNLGFVSAFVNYHTLYVFGTNAWGGGQGDEVYVLYTHNLFNWSKPRLVYKSSGMKLFNTSVTRYPGGYIMALETCEKGKICFNVKFLFSGDLINWSFSNLSAGGPYYTACPTIRWYNGYFYLVVLSNFSPKWATTIMRSHNLVNWQESRQAVVVPDYLDVNNNTSDIDFVDIYGITHIIYAVGSQTEQWNDKSVKGFRRAYFYGSEQRFLELFFNL